MSRVYKIIYFILIFLSIKTFAQPNPINQFDAKGKKTGYWKIFLDEHAMPTDSANAYLFGYEYFDNGKSIMNIFITEKNLTRYKIIYEGKLPEKGSPIPIDGTIKWFFLNRDKVVGLKIWSEFDNGYPKTIKEYFASDSTLLTMNDFTKKYNNEPGTFYVESYYGFIVISSRQKIKKYWYRKEKNKWKACKIK